MVHSSYKSLPKHKTNFMRGGNHDKAIRMAGCNTLGSGAGAATSTTKYENGLICVTLSAAKGLLLPQREILRLRLRMTFSE